MNKENIFAPEIEYIKDPIYKEDAKTLISNLPDYFFRIPASSTGKYHPSFSLDEGGLVRHTKAAVRIANELLITKTFGDEYTPREKDLMILALLIHDGLKSGIIEEKYTRVDHPILIAKFLYENKDNLKMDDEDRKFLTGLLETHMGEWNKDFKGNVVLPVPTTKYQKFVHMCDYLSSKRFLDIKFENNEIKD